MANSVDKRIVEMQFDNSRFERNVNQSISTLDKLKNALDFSKNSNAFDGLERQANNIDFSGLEKSISNIEHRFSALGIVGATVINTLTNKVLGAVGKLNNAVFGQIKSGGISRALNLEHANFMLNGLLKNADKVAEIMGEGGPVQNAVKGTAYGLDAAANAAAQFVASGVKDTDKLETALTAISGAAAMTGSSYEDISNIFTTVAANGRLMGDQLMQFSARGLNASAALAESLNKTEGEIREMVSKGKIDFETFADVMNKAFGEQAKKANDTFTGALSNVKAALSRIGAKVATPAIENLRVIFVKLIDVIDNTSKALQPVIDFINNMFYSISEGIDLFLSNTGDIDKFVRNVVTTIGNLVKTVYSFILPIKRALEDIFPQKTMEDAVILSDRIKHFTQTLVLSAEQMVTVRRIFRGVFSVFDIAIQAISALIRVLFPAVNGIHDFFGSITNGAATIGDYIYALSLVLKETDAFYKIFSHIKDYVGSALSFITEKVKKFVSAFKDLNGIKFNGGGVIDAFKNFAKSVKDNSAPLEFVGNLFKTVFGGIQEVITGVSPLLGSFVGMIGRALGELANGFEKAFNGGGFRSLMALVSSGLLASIAVDIAYFISNMVGTLSRGVGLIAGVRGVLTQLTNTLKVTQTKIKSEALLNLAKAIGILVASVAVLALLDTGKAAGAVAMITVLMAELIGLTFLIEKFTNTWQANGALLSAGVMFIGLAAAVIVLAGAMKTISSIPTDRLEASLETVTLLLLELTGVAVTLGATEAKIKAGSVALLSLTVSIKILASAMQQITTIPADRLMDSLGVVTALLLELLGLTLVLSATEAKIKTGALSLIELSVAVKILASAMSDIGSLTDNQLIKGLIGVSTALVGLAAAAALLSLTDFSIFQGGGILLMAIGIKAIAEAMQSLSTIPDESIGNTIGLFAALVGTLALFGLIGNFISNMLLTASALVVMAIGINLLVPALQGFQSVADNGYTALLALGGALTIIGVAAAIFGAASTVMLVGAAAIAAVSAACLLGAAAMAATAVAIQFLADAFERLGTIDWGTILSGIGKFAAVAISLGVMGALIAPLAITMGILAAAMALISVACLGLAASITVAAFGIAMLADAIKKFENVSPEGIANAITVLQQAILALVGAAWMLAPISPVLVLIGAGVFAIGSGSLMAAASLIIFAQAFEMLAPIVQEVAPAIQEFCNYISENFEQILAEAGNILLDFGQGLSNFVINIGAAIMKGLADLGGNILKYLVQLGADMLKSLGVPEDYVNVARDFMLGLINGLTNGVKDVIDKVKEIGKSMIASIRDAIDSHSASKETTAVGEDFDLGLGDGVDNLKQWVIDKVAKVGEGMIEQAKSDANKVAEVWEAVNKFYGRNLEFDVGLKNGEWISAGGVYYNTKTGQEKNLTTGYDSEKFKAAIGSINQETKSLGGNTKATKGNSKAKKENEKANEGKTKAIDEETESLEGEEEQTEETSEDIRAMAEQIEVVTEEYNKFNHYIGINTKLLKKGRFKQYAKNTEKLATATYTSLSQITQAFRQMSKGIKATTRVSDRGLYKFGEGLKKVDKLYKAKKIKKSSAAIEKYIAKTGRSIAKISGDVVKVFYKDGNRMSKIYFNAAKNIQKVPKQFKKAMDTAKFFANDMNETINKYDWSDEPIEHLRMIEESFGKVKFGKMTNGVSEYLRNIKHRFDELDPTMRQISKELGGTFNVLSKNSRVVPATMDALISLGAVLYNGSDAANEYATKIAQLEFLYKHNEISWEELQEAKIDYLTRIKDALVEYKQTLDETYNAEVDMFTAFNKNELEKTENIIKNQMSNIAGYYTYGEMLNEFARRGPALEQTGQIIKQLAEGGVQNFGKLRAILKLTDQELKAFVYGYGVLTKTQEETANKAMAAIALSTSYADKRQQALTKDIKKKTTQYSAQVRKMIESDMYAVAQAATQTNKLRKKDEKEYLKTLTKKEKATYKQYKRELNAAKKAFNKQQKLLKSQEQIDNTFKNIKSIDAFIEAMQKYSDNAYFMSQINEKLEDSLEEVIKGVGGTTDATIDLLKLAKEFGAEGKDIDSIISSVSDKINSWRDGIKNATKDVKNFFDEFKRGDAINPNKVLSNFANRVSAIAEFSSGFGKLTSMGFSGKIVKWVGELYSSNMEEALRYIQAFMASDAKQVQLWNEYFDEVEKLSEDITNKAVKAASESNKKSDTQLAFEAASARVTEAEQALKRFQNDETKYGESMARYTQLVIQNGSEMNQAFMEMDKRFNTADAYSKAANGAFHSIFTQIPYYAKEGIDEIANLTGVSLEKKLSLMQDYARRYYQTEENRFYKNQKDELERTIANLANVDASDVHAMMVKQQAMSKLKHLEEEYAKTTGGYIDRVQQQMKADKAAAEAALNKANAELSVAAAEEQLRKDTEEANKKGAEALIQQERNYQDVTRAVINLDDAKQGYIVTVRKYIAVSGVIKKALDRITAATDKVAGAVDKARKNFGTMFSEDGLIPMGDLLIPEIDLIAEGFLRLAETLESVNDETDDFIENMGNRLEAYRKTLYDTLNTQSNLFDEFKKFSGDKATGATTYLDNMKSQVDAIEEWTTNMETLARRGVSGEILKMFASEGVSSYEKVAAFASATKEELAELNYRYKQYAKLVDDATDRTLATLGYAFTTTAKNISDELAKNFQERAGSQLQEAAYVAGTMVITGVKDGLSNASPQIVAEVEGVANKITTTMSETLTADAIEESIRKGLVTMSGAIQNTVGVIVSDFLDSVTNTSIQKFKMAVDSAKNYVQQTLPTDYTITIHVDASEMDAAIARMNGAISGTYVTANQTSSAVVASQEHQAPIVPLNDTQPTNNTVVNYTQNNYSPKSLSRADIYRQTQNQLSTIAGVVSSATP